MRASQLIRRCRSLGLACVPLVTAAQAATKTWVGPLSYVSSGNWSVGSNWTGGVPANGDTAVIATNLSNSSPFSVTYDVDGSGLTLGSLSLSADTSGNTVAPATLSIAANTLNASIENIGGFTPQSNGNPKYGLGVVTQSGGSNNVSSLSLGNQNYATGVYTLSGTGVVNATNEYLGNPGQAIVNQLGGTNNVSSTLTTGNGSMTYNLSGGTLSCGTESLGTGQFSQTGGSNTCATFNAGFVSPQTLQANYGTVSISAGTTTANNSANVGQMLTTGSPSTTYVAPGELNISGTGSFSSPSVTIAPFGVLNLAGGTLSTSAITLQSFFETLTLYTGEFNWKSGTLNIPASTVFDSGGSGMGAYFGSSLSLASGQILSVTGQQTLGGSNAFTLTVPTGAADISSSILNVSHSSVLNLTGGKVTASSLNLNGYLTDFNWTSGTLEISSALVINPNNSTTFFGSLLTLSSGMTLQQDSNEQMENTATNGTFTMNVSGGANTVTTDLTVSEHGTLNILSGSVSAARIYVTSGGKVNFSGGSFTPGAFILSGSSVLTIAAANQTFVLSTLTVDNTSRLVLDKTDLIVHGGNLANITSMLAAGFNGGNWNGPSGIQDSAAGTARMALGVNLGSNFGSNTFEGQPVLGTDVLIKYTYYGDTNLDGKVDGSDYSRIDAAYLADKTSSTAQTGWFNGDFNYDSVINGSDYTLMDNAFNTQGALLAEQLAAPSAQVVPTIGTAAVPEPTALAMMISSACLFLRRRRLV